MRRSWQRATPLGITQTGMIRGNTGGLMQRAIVVAVAVALLAPAHAQKAAVSAKPDTPFKLATFEPAGKMRVGLVLGARVLDIAGASAALVRDEHLAAVTIPGDMRALIENYSRVSPRLYQIANYFNLRQEATSFSFEL